ncbi:hypothetical protein [Gryllotalpicola ginsengisoli]|uniref:hypothetical protein n=1 Tax=Gryllotalpicola ginsengisoli TaxID=444608 RepID=UPI0012DCB13B|nr:hypothetical protein [Gryllotalpicola ginsengisoli]
MVLTVRLHSRAPGDVTREVDGSRRYVIGGSEYDRLIRPVAVEVPLPSSRRPNPFVWSRVATVEDWLYLLRVSIDELFVGWDGGEAPRLDEGCADARENGRTEIEFNVDWGWPWPLWEAEGAMWPGRYGLSVGLTRRLEAWVATWAAQATEFGPWRDEAARPAWVAEGLHLANELREEVREFADVSYTVV